MNLSLVFIFITGLKLDQGFRSPKRNGTNGPLHEKQMDEVIGCRWTISVLGAVAKGIHRPRALERHIEGISAKVLSDRLRHFMRAGIFERVQFPEIPSRVEYRLTDFGKKFRRLLKEVEKL